MKELIPILLFACAADPPVVRGPRVTEVSREMRICIEQGTLAENAEVRFTRRVCREMTPKMPAIRCHEEPVLTAHVTRLVDSHCGMVVVPADGNVQPGDGIEVVTR